MSDPILRPLGGRYGEMARMGIEITPATDPTEVELEFVGPVTFSNDMTMTGDIAQSGDVALTGELSSTKMPTVQGSDLVLVQQGALTASDTAGAIFSWVNPWAVPVLILEFILEVTTVATAACTVDAGIAANATTSSDELLDGQDVNAATGFFASTTPLRLDEAGGTQDTVTVSKATGAAAGLAGRAYIRYVPIQ